MLPTRFKRLVVLTTAVMVLSAFVGAASAGAGEAARDSGDRAAVEQAAPRAPLAPTCIERFYHNHIAYKEVHMYNGCGGTRYVKVIVAYGPDSACTQINNGRSWTFRWYHGWPFALSRFDRLESC